jgi:hypothetical protein
MRYMIFALGLISMLWACSGPRTAGRSESGKGSADERNSPAPGVSPSFQFGVKVQFADAATKKLIDSQETIIVAGYFTARPKQGTEARYLDIKSGDVVLGDVRSEIRPGESAIFDELNLNPGALARMDSQGPHILINVYSGRKSSKDNLLDCEDYDGAFGSIHGRIIVISCQLIDERFPRPVQ